MSCSKKLLSNNSVGTRCLSLSASKPEKENLTSSIEPKKTACPKRFLEKYESVKSAKSKRAKIMVISLQYLYIKPRHIVDCMCCLGSSGI